MTRTNYSVINLLFYGFLLIRSVMSHWDFSVITNNKISFFDKNWTTSSTGGQQFTNLSAMAFDETEEIIYFNDNDKNFIYSLKLSETDDNHFVSKIIQKTSNILDMTFDPWSRTLFWIDSKNSRIYSSSVDTENNTKILIQFTDGEYPQSITVDACRRKLYWTNSNHKKPSIERASLNGDDREQLIISDLFMPMGIAVDQYSERIYWVDDKSGHSYSVESATLDGKGRINITVDRNQEPIHIAVDREFIYWTEKVNDAVWKISKNSSNEQKPERVRSFATQPLGIVARTDFLKNNLNNSQCMEAVTEIRRRTLTPLPPTNSTEPCKRATENNFQLTEKYCLNGGSLIPKTQKCLCLPGYSGKQCETNECFNFCLHGECFISSVGYPECKCDDEYTGPRCENNVCDDYCLNGGTCKTEQNDPICHCTGIYSGRRCETLNLTKINCQKFCDDGTVIKGLPLNMSLVCGNCNRNAINANIPKEPAEPEFENLSKSVGDSSEAPESSVQQKVCVFNNMSIIIISSSVIIALLLILGIIHGIRRMNKPLRPKIRKTYVVHKNVTPTPLTCRPATTEQCEITIEDCCNMNICETPCFNPKTLQKEAKKESCKSDKKKLLDMDYNDIF